MTIVFKQFQPDQALHVLIWYDEVMTCATPQVWKLLALSVHVFFGFFVMCFW